MAGQEMGRGQKQRERGRERERETPVGQARVIDRYSAHAPKPAPRHSNHMREVWSKWLLYLRDDGGRIAPRLLVLQFTIAKDSIGLRKSLA
jgi:hypothetical protein